MLLIKRVLLVLAAIAALAQGTNTSDPTGSASVSGGSSTVTSPDPSDGADGADGASALAVVTCVVDACSVELQGAGSRVEVLGTSISLADVVDDRATLRVDDQDVSCAESATLTAGSIALECTRVDDDAVEFTASRA